MIRKAPADHCHHFPGDPIRWKTQWLRNGNCFRERFAIISVIIPLPAQRLTTIHQPACSPAHLTIEVFDAELLAPRRPAREVGGRAEEARVGQYVDGQREPPGPRGLHLADPPLARLGDDHPLRLVAGDRLAQLRGEGAAVALRIQGHILDPPAEPAQLGREVAHRREQEGDLLVLGWGSTYGAINEAVTRVMNRGLKVSQVHLKYINPLPKELGDILKRFKRILLPEINLGHMAMILRSQYLVDIIQYNKVQGLPFKASEIEEKILNLLGVENE